MRCIDASGGGPLIEGMIYETHPSTTLGMIYIDGRLWCIERFVIVEGEVPEPSRECKCGIRREMCTYHRSGS